MCSTKCDLIERDSMIGCRNLSANGRILCSTSAAIFQRPQTGMFNKYSLPFWDDFTSLSIRTTLQVGICESPPSISVSGVRDGRCCLQKPPRLRLIDVQRKTCILRCHFAMSQNLSRAICLTDIMNSVILSPISATGMK